MEEKYQNKYAMHFEQGSNPTIYNDAKIEIHVQGDFYNTNVRPRKPGEPLPDHPQQDGGAPEDLSEGGAKDDLTEGGAKDDLTDSGAKEDLTEGDLRIKKAVEAVSRDKAFKYRYDWAWVRIAMAESKASLLFQTTESYKEYLHRLGIGSLPTTSLVNRYFSSARRNRDGYSFTDTADRTETLRRNNVIRCFLAAYNKG